jgi:anti-sigma regulatory factor (Ser/Thr protein kinase)
MRFDPGGYGGLRTELDPKAADRCDPAGQEARVRLLPRRGDCRGRRPRAPADRKAPRGYIILPDGVKERLDLSVAPGLAASGTARDALATWAEGYLSPPVIADLQLLVSELVTNCLRHADLAADDAIHVMARLNHSSLRLEVENPGVFGDVQARTPGENDGGFGLQLVATLSERWGVERDGSTCVWVEVDSQPEV